VSEAQFRQALEALQRYGLLLTSDRTLPSVASLVTGKPIRGSWWAHPAAHDIYDVADPLGDHPDVIIAKLVSGKNTYLHRRLWPAVHAVGRAREPWQLDRLSPMAQRLLDVVTRQGTLRTADVPWTGGPKKDSPGEAARQLERRLLVRSEEVHTETGAHAKQLETWERWARRVGLAEREMTPERARTKLEDVLAGLNERFQANGRLA
jgi:hypothetical protein